jgi:hypothetical protein
MYLVELRPGREELFTTGDELEAAIRGGDVTIQSRIFHRAKATWISIMFHPRYRAIEAERSPTPPPPPGAPSFWTWLH